MENYVICNIPIDNDDFQVDVLSDGSIRVSYFQEGHFLDEIKFFAPQHLLKSEFVHCTIEIK